MAKRKFNIEDLPGNSRTSLPPSMPLEGKVSDRPVGGLSNKIRDLFNSLWDQVVIPQVKRGFVDFVQEGVERMVQPGIGSSRRGKKNIAYDKPYRNARGPVRRAPVRTQEIQTVFRTVYFESRRDAEHVLGRLMENILEYEQATVGDLYHWVGLPADYAHQNWGWTDLHGVNVQYTTEGFIIALPEPQHLRR